MYIHVSVKAPPSIGHCIHVHTRQSPVSSICITVAIHLDFVVVRRVVHVEHPCYPYVPPCVSICTPMFIHMCSPMFIHMYSMSTRVCAVDGGKRHRSAGTKCSGTRHHPPPTTPYWGQNVCIGNLLKKSMHPVDQPHNPPLRQHRCACPRNPTHSSVPNFRSILNGPLRCPCACG